MGKQVKNAADKVRKMLFNYDLELTVALGEQKLAKAKSERYEGYRSKKKRELYANARIDEEKLNVFVDQLIKGKNEAWTSLEAILETYTPQYKKVWIMCFISKNSHSEIAEKCNYSLDQTKKIIQKLKKDLISYDLMSEDSLDNEDCGGSEDENSEI